MSLPHGLPVAVFSNVAAHVGDVLLGGPEAMDLTHRADLVVYPDSVAAVFKQWVLPRENVGFVLVQNAGPLRLRVGRFPPWQNTVVWVRQDQRLAMLLVSPRQRRALREALAVTGFGMKEDRMSLTHGRARYEP